MTTIQINPGVMQSRLQRTNQLVSGLQAVISPKVKSETGWKIKVSSPPKIEVCGDLIYVSANMSLHYLTDYTIYWNSQEKRETYPFVSKTRERASGRHVAATTSLYFMAEEPGIYAQVHSLFVGDPNQGFGSRCGVDLQEDQILDIAEGYVKMIKFLRDNSIEEPMPNDSGRIFVLRP